jgi:hypothetical protein
VAGRIKKIIIKFNKARDICVTNLVWRVFQCMEIVGGEKLNIFSV